MAQRPVVTRTVLPTAAALATAVAQALTDRLAMAQRERRVPSVCLTGGTIAAQIHQQLAQRGAGSAVDWSRVDFWWGDERFVAADSPDRNDRDVLEVLDALGASSERVHRVPTDEGQGVAAAAERYDAALREQQHGDFDVVMLGVGPDGHVASLFPGHRTLEVSDRLAVAVTDSPKPPPERVSMTLSALNRAREVWFVASGAAKAPAVAAAQRPGPYADLPARAVRGRLSTTWWLDEDAAAGDDPAH